VPDGPGHEGLHQLHPAVHGAVLGPLGLAGFVGRVDVSTKASPEVRGCGGGSRSGCVCGERE
jgi:hypothetical protein